MYPYMITFVYGTYVIYIYTYMMYIPTSYVHIIYLPARQHGGCIYSNVSFVFFILLYIFRSHFGSSVLKSFLPGSSHFGSRPVICMSGASASQEEGVDDDGMLVCGDDAPVALEAVTEAAAGVRHRVRRAARSGAFYSWVVANRTLPSPVCTADMGPEPASPADMCVVAVARCEWLFVESSADAIVVEESLATCGARSSRGWLPWGHVQYRVAQAWPFAEPWVLPANFDATAVDASFNLRRSVSAVIVGSGNLLRQVLLKKVGGVSMHVLELPWFLALDAVGLQQISFFRSVPLRLRNDDLSSLVPGAPRRSLIASWRRELDVLGRHRTREASLLEPADVWTKVALELPRCTKKGIAVGDEGDLHPDCYAQEHDPLHVLRAINCSAYLRGQRDFSAAMQAAEEYDHPDLAPEDKRDPKKDPPRTARQKAMARADVTGMLLQRRELKADRLLDRVFTVNLYTDSSPVTGEELQGMVMEVITTAREVRRDVLPGSSLSYGQCNIISKTMALVYALWLAAGPFCFAISLGPYPKSVV